MKLGISVFIVLNIIALSYGLLNILPTVDDITCLPCQLKVCNGSSSIPVSRDVCGLAAGIGAPGPYPRKDCFPAWMNLTKFRQGQNYMTQHLGKFTFTETIALVGLLAFPELNDVLLFTVTNDCPMQVDKRYPTTTNQISLWAKADINIPGNPCAILKSLNKVRDVHQHAAERVRRVNMPNGNLHSISASRFSATPVKDSVWDAFKADLELAYSPTQLAFDPCYAQAQTNGIPLNQFAYTVTQWSFSSQNSMSKERALLAGSSDADIDAFQHFWAVVGNMMGIEDQFNIALQPNPAAQRQMCNDFTSKYVVPAVYHMSHESKVMVELTLSRTMGNTAFSLLGIELPNPIPPEVLLLGFLRLTLNVPYANVYAASSAEAKLLIDRLGDVVNNSLPPASTLDPPLTAFSEGQILNWGNTYFGLCYATWNTQCQIANKVHYKYDGPDVNPDGQLSADGYCNAPRLLDIFRC